MGVFFGCVIDVLGYGEGDGGVGDGFAEEPGYALLIRVLVREDSGEGRGGRLPFGGYDRNHRRGFYSRDMLGAEVEVGWEKRTIVHTPLRSCSVLSGGAAIVTCALVYGQKEMDGEHSDMFVVRGLRALLE